MLWIRALSAGVGGFPDILATSLASLSIDSSSFQLLLGFATRNCRHGCFTSLLYSRAVASYIPLTTSSSLSISGNPGIFIDSSELYAIYPNSLVSVDNHRHMVYVYKIMVYMGGLCTWCTLFGHWTTLVPISGRVHLLLNCI